MPQNSPAFTATGPTQQYEAIDPKTGERWVYDGQNWNPSQPAITGGPFKRALTQAAGLPENVDLSLRGNIDTAKQMAEHPLDTSIGALEQFGSAINPLGGLEGSEAISRQRFSQPGISNKLAGGLEYLESGVPYVGPPTVRATEQGMRGDYAGMLGSSVNAALQALGVRKIAPAVADTLARPTLRGILGMGSRPEEKAQLAFNKTMEEARNQYQADLDAARTKNAGNRAAAMDAARKAEEAYQTKINAARQLYQETLGKRTEASAQQSAAEAKKSVTGTVKSGPVFQRLSSMADAVATNAKKARDATRAFYDTQWARLRKEVGDAKTNWQPVQQAVINARQNMLQGSPESIKIFNNILKEGSGGKEFIDTEEGAKPIATSPTEIPYKDAQGYYTELGTKIFGGGEIPGDVWRALNHVRETIGDQMAENHKAAGPGIEQFANQLRGQWAQFMQDFYDPDSPTRKLINQQQSQGRIQQLAADNDNLVAQILGRYQQFGGDPSLAGKVRSLRGQIARLPGTSPEMPELPFAAARKALGQKPLESKVNISEEPSAPEERRFDPVEWRRRELESRVKSGESFNWYMLRPWYWPLLALKQGGGRVLDMPGVSDWLSGATNAMPEQRQLPVTLSRTRSTTPPTVAGPTSPTRPPTTPPVNSTPPWAIGPLLKAVKEQQQRQAFEDLVKRLGGSGKVGPL